MQILSNLSLYGTLGLNSVADANTDTDKFLVIDSNGIVKYRTGQELYNDIGAGGAAAYTSTLQHEVKAGVALTKGQAVYVTSADGTNMIVSKASNASEATSSKTLGLIAQDLNINGKGYVITEGLLSGLNTMAAGTEGDPVWLGTDGNLIYGLGSKPYAPDHLVFIGIVTRKNANNGEIFVKVQNGFELQELHNVQITSTPSDNTVLAYETSTSLYKMKSIPALLGYTPTTNARTLTINGTSYDLSADRSWSVGTHTGNLTTGYVPKATGTTTLTDSLIYDNGSAIGINTNSPYESSAFKLDVNGGVIIKNTNGTTAQLILINSNPATGGNNGFVQLSAGGNTATAFGQWQTYYGMSVASGALRLQPAGGQVLIGTTTTSAFTTDINGTLRVSGQLTLGSTISNNTYVYTMPGASGTLALVSQIPSLSGYVQTSRTLTINGVSYDLSADRSWSIAAGISSIASGTGISVSTVSGVATITNTGLLSAASGTGISVSTSNQQITVTNTGLLSAASGTGISVSTANQQITVTNLGLLSAASGNGISVSTANQQITITNTGILSLISGTGISISTVNGAATITNTITNNNQLTNGAGYITSSALTGYATQSYVNTAISNLVDSAPGTLDTLNELAAALGDDPNFATTIAASIGGKQAQLNGTGFVKASGTTITYDNSTYYLASNPSGYITGITSGMVTTALGYTPYNSSNPSGYVTSSNWAILGGGVSYNIDRTTKVSSGLAIYSAYTGGANSPTTYDISSQYVISGRAMEIAASWHSPSAVMYFRTLRDCCENWSAWVTMLSSANYNDYAPTKTGGGASGSWDISVTGNAATVSVNSSSGDNWYNVLWHSGNTIYNTPVSSGVTIYAAGAYLRANYFNTYGGGSERNGSGLSYVAGFNSSDYYIRSYNSTAVASFLGLGSMAYASTGSYLPLSGGTLTGTLSGTSAGFTGNVTWQGINNGNPRSLAIGYSGGNYGQAGYGVTYTSGGAHNYAINDIVSLWEAYDGIRVLAAGAGTVGTAISWTTVLDARRNTFSWMGNTVIHTGNYSSYALPLGGGTMSGQIYGPSIDSGAYGGLIQIRERGYVSNGQSDWNYSPAITFHWGNRFAVRLGFDYQGYLAVDNVRFLNAGNYTSYSPSLTGSGASGTWGINISGVASQVSINYSNDSNSTYQLLWGSGNSVYGTAGVYVNPYDDRVYANYFSSVYYMDVYTSAGSDYLRITDNQVYRPGGGGLYLNWSSNANVFITGSGGGYVGVGNNSPSYKLHVSGDIYANGGWLRVSGSAGIYFESYAGGWRMTDSSYIRAYNGKALSMEGASVDYVGSIYMNGGVYIQTSNNRNLQVKSTGGADNGILGRGSSDQFAYQLYGDGAGSYGFLNGAWAAWDLRKATNGRLYMNDNNGYYLQTNSDSYVYRLESATDLRAPIFYDSNDGSYYLDPNSTSNIAASYIGRVLINYDGTDTWFRMQSGNRMRITTTGGTDFIIPNTGNMTYNGNNVWHAGNDGSGSGLDADLLDGYDQSYFFSKVNMDAARNIVSGTNLDTDLENGGAYSSYGAGGTSWNAPFSYGGVIGFAFTSGIRAQFGFDIRHTQSNYGDLWYRTKNNVGYATWRKIWHTGNQGSGSGLDADTVDGYHATNAANGLAYYASNGYLYAPSWINVGIAGIFSGTNNAHIRPNQSNTYGAWEMIGSRNGWSGIWFNDSGNTLMMNSSESGHYMNGYGWQYRWYQGTMYTSRSTYGGGTEFTILDSGNYTSWAQQRVYQGQSAGDWQTFTNDVGEFRVDEVLNINAGGHSNQPPNVYTYGGVLSWRLNNHSFQLYASHTGDITFKTQWGNDNYSGWRRILHEANYNSWAPSLTGGGASGTWGISVTGSSASISLTGISSVNVNNSQTAVYRTESGSGAALAYAPVLHVGGGDTMWQVQGTYGTSGNGTLYFRQGYSGSWGNWLTIISSANIGSQSVSYASNSGALNGYGSSNYLGKNGNSYYQQDTWIQSTGSHGLYAPSSGAGTHWFPGISGSYGSWRIEGYKNSYYGIELANGTVVGMIDTTGNGGNWDPSTGWHFYWYESHSCLGIGGSSTISGYRAKTNGSHYVDGLLYASNYVQAANNGYFGGDVIAYYSDARLKENVKPLENVLDKISKIGGYTYTANDLALQIGAAENKEQRLGVLAQEIKEVFPEVVTQAPFDRDPLTGGSVSGQDYMTVKYERLVPVLIQAIKEQQKQIEDLKSELNGLTK
jgi:hypothetical protein